MKEQIKDITGLKIQENKPLKDYTTFKIGGPARYFVEVTNKPDLLRALRACRELDLPFYILGGGSNVLVADDGFNGLIIKLGSGEVEFLGGGARVFAGNNWMKFVRKTVEKGLTGLEFGANIPGSVGGAIYGNAGAYGQGVGDFIESVEVIVLDKKEINLKVLSAEECVFSYRHSLFKENKNWIIAEAVFKLSPSEKAEEKLKQINQEWRERQEKQPLNKPSAGCSFKNVPAPDDLGKIPRNWVIKGKIPAARLIEEVQMKGVSLGGAKVSDKHANFIVNHDQATADDVVQLISMIKSKVRVRYNLQLEEEVQYVGF